MKALNAALVAILLGSANLANAQFLGDIFSLSENGWLKDQWQKLDISVNVGINPDIDYVEAQARYHYKVQPAFVKGLHQRTDSWIGQISTDANSLILLDGTPFGVGGAIGAQATFSRLFKSKNEALTQKPYFLNRLPWTADKALASLKEGDAVRIEMFLDMALGLGKYGGTATWSIYGSIDRSRGLRFLADVYRLKNNKVRLRLIGQRNDGVTNMGVTAEPLRQLDFGTGILSRYINKWGTCHLLDLGTSLANIENLPLDTLMLDYVFQLSNPEAVAAYNKTMDALYHLRYRELLNPWLIIEGRKVASERIKTDLVFAANEAERVFTADKTISAQARRVDRIFKGVSQTAMNTGNAQTSCLHLWNLQLVDASSRTMIKAFDRNDIPTYQIFENLQVDSKQSILFSTWEASDRTSIGALFSASSDKGQNPTSLDDVVFTLERRDKDYRYSEYLSLKNYLSAILPNKTFSQIDWTALEQNGPLKRTNVNSLYQIVFHQDALSTIPDLGNSGFYQRLYNYVFNFPNRDYLTADREPNSNPEGGLPTDPMGRFKWDLERMSASLELMFNKEGSNTDKLNAFTDLRENKLFRQLGAGFLMSLLPNEKADSLVSFRININGADNLNMTYKNSVPGLSPAYAAYSYIVALINDHAFDLRLQLDESGNVLPTE